MNEHTEGPWHWVNAENDQPWDDESDIARVSLRTVEVFGANETVDGRRYFALPKFILNPDDGLYAGDFANFRLIAVAPTLLDALQTLVNAKSTTAAMWDAARAAIQSATHADRDAEGKL